MLDFDSTFIPSDQSLIQEPCPVTKTLQSAAVIVIEEMTTFQDAIGRKSGVRIENQLIMLFQDTNFHKNHFPEKLRNTSD